MLNKWNFRFINLAKEVASWSKEGKQVGCVITNINTNKVLATGYNGLSNFMNDSCLCSLSKEDKAVIALHAEHNALDQLSKEDYNKNLALYVTKTPCRLCAIKIVNSHANIKKIYYVPSKNESFNQRYNTQDSINYLLSNGINVIPIDYRVNLELPIIIVKYLTANSNMSTEEIGYFVQLCSPLIDRLDTILTKAESYQDSIFNILNIYGYYNILKFCEEEESVSPDYFLNWYQTNILD